MVGTVEVDEAAVERLRDDLQAHWADGDEYDLRTPAYSRMLRTLGEELDDQTRQDVRSVIESPGTPRSVAESLDEVDVALLMAARNERQLYRLSRLGEDIGLASPTKFSRAKRRLENAALIETHQVQVGMGRPRQKLLLAGDVAGLEPDGVVGEAESALS